MAFPLRVAAAAAVLAGVASAFGPPSNEATVLVFGDSQGDVGPTYQVVADVLQEHGVAHKVVNVVSDISNISTRHRTHSSVYPFVSFFCKAGRCLSQSHPQEDI